MEGNIPTNPPTPHPGLTLTCSIYFRQACFKYFKTIVRMLAPGHTHNISFPFIKPGEKWKLSFSQCMVIKLGMQYAWNGGGGGPTFNPFPVLKSFLVKEMNFDSRIGYKGYRFKTSIFVPSILYLMLGGLFVCILSVCVLSIRQLKCLI